MKVIGYIHSGKLGKNENDFLRISKEKGLEVRLLNISQSIDLKELQEMELCDIVYNDSGEDFAIEFIKIFENMGIPVMESSKAYFDENKWNFYEKCIKYGIPAPLTIKLSKNVEDIKKQLIEFNHWPVILKRVRGTWGEFVARANNVDEAVAVVEGFWNRGGTKHIPIIAQEFVDSFSYRVTYIGDEILQTAIKENNNWKCTGVYAKNFKTFDIDPTLKDIVQRIMKHTDIKICGIDLLKKGDEWLVIEANAEPALDFFEIERTMLIEKIIDLLIKECPQEPEPLVVTDTLLKIWNNKKDDVWENY